MVRAAGTGVGDGDMLRRRAQPEIGQVPDAGDPTYLKGAIEYATPPGHHVRAYELARGLGWAKTYDAEYVSLALAVAAPLVTLDARLRPGAAGTVTVLGPAELELARDPLPPAAIRPFRVPVQRQRDPREDRDDERPVGAVDAGDERGRHAHHGKRQEPHTDIPGHVRRASYYFR